MAPERKLYTFADVLKHNDRHDCWVVINNKVYNMTNFLDDHPGGDDVVLTKSGLDATQDFEDTGHSSTAIAMMDEFYVGDIDSSSEFAKPTWAPLEDPLYGGKKKPDFVTRLLTFLVPLLILGLAFGSKFYGKSSTA